MTPRLFRISSLAAILLALLVPLRAFGAVVPEADRKPAPAFHLTDAQGKTVELSHYRGRVVLLNFWATWCHGCQTEIPWFAEYAKKYASKGFGVIGASMDEDGWTSVRPYLAKSDLPYPIVIGNQALASSYGLETMPWTVLIDRDGRIAATYSGVVSRDGCDEDIQALIGASAPRGSEGRRR